jgi:hypothetical protein
VSSLTLKERALYHQIHPAKLVTDVSATLTSLFFFRQHRLLIASIIHCVPPIVASALIAGLMDLTRQQQTRFGRYVKRTMTRTVEAVRLAGDIVMVCGAWYRSGGLIALGFFVIVLAGLSGFGAGGRAGHSG